MSTKASIRWAKTLHDPNTRCAICGVPNFWLRQQYRWKEGGEQNNRRLSLDHKKPGSCRDGYRALCFSCNKLRGPAELSDREVLEIMRRWYRRYWNPRLLYWLNTVPGKGGTLNRNEHTAARDERLRYERDEEEGAGGR